jgi:outer membrane biosynthesis protein TonB
MAPKNLTPLLSFALLLGGCPNRKSAPRVVFAPPAAPTAQNTAPASSGKLVIAEPPPPQPEVVPAEQQPQESTVQKTPVRPRRHVSTADPAPETPEATPDTVPQPPPTVPALEPRESPQQQSELRSRVVQTQESVRARIRALRHTSMSNLDRKTLDGAQMFLVQSERARDSNDLQRAFNLARKASLLVDALEQKP